MGAIDIRPDRSRAVVIEDSASDFAVVESVLSARGYDVIPVEPGPATEAIAVYQPRLIVLSADVKNGFNVCLRYKKDPVLRRVPLVLTTAKASAEVLRKHRLLPTRADGYVRKPLTEIDVLTTFAELLPEDFKTPAPAPVGAEIPERTLVAQGMIESAVVNYVEEEVRTLKDVVHRLESEKTELTMKLTSLEHELKSEQYRLDSGLKQLAQQARDVVTQEVVDAVREDTRRQSLEVGRREGREEGAREAREAADSQIENLRARVESQEATLKAARETEEATRREMLEMQMLFERLEAGYKTQLDAIQAERAAYEESAARAESEAESLRVSGEATVKAEQELAELRPVAARVEILEEECRVARAEAERLRAEREALAQAARDAEGARAKVEARFEAQIETVRGELVAARQQAETATQEAERLREILERLRSFLGPGEAP
jgi:CheY-like chemotaxis protein